MSLDKFTCYGKRVNAKWYWYNPFTSIALLRFSLLLWHWQLSHLVLFCLEQVIEVMRNNEMPNELSEQLHFWCFATRSPFLNAWVFVPLRSVHHQWTCTGFYEKLAQTVAYVLILHKCRCLWFHWFTIFGSNKYQMIGRHAVNSNAVGEQYWCCYCVWTFESPSFRI